MTIFRSFTDTEREALRLHGLDTKRPSQLSDAFVLGLRHATPPAAASGQAAVQEVQPHPEDVKWLAQQPMNDWGGHILYDTNEVDEVAHALTGDEGEDDSLTVLRRLAAYVENVWPGKTAKQVLIEYEEAAASQPSAQTDDALEVRAEASEGDGQC